jgi:hypothetical protein
MSAPEVVVELARARLAARAAKDWALADQLRNQIAELGFEVLDVADGFEFKLKSPFPIVSRIGDLRKFSDKKFASAIGLIADGFVDDLVLSVKAIKEYAPTDCAILILISGNPELFDLTSQLDARTFIAQIQEGVGWGEAANAILKFAPAPYVFIMDPSTRFLGNAVTPALELLETGEWAAVGWRGGLVNVDDEWRSVEDKGSGEVDVLFSYFLGLNRESAIECGGFNNRAIYYRNADIEFSLRLRQAQGRLNQLELPLEQARHHGYYDTDPEFRDEQSKKNYDRILERFRGKNEILVPRR